MTTKGTPLTIAPAQAQKETTSPRPSPSPTPAPTPASKTTMAPTVSPTAKSTTGPPSSRPHVPKWATCENGPCECRPDYGCNTCVECCSNKVSDKHVSTIQSGAGRNKRTAQVLGCMQCVVFACPQFMRIRPPTTAPTPVATAAPTSAPTPTRFYELDGGQISVAAAGRSKPGIKAHMKQARLGKLLIGLVTGGHEAKSLARLEHQVDVKERQAYIREQTLPTPLPTAPPTPARQTPAPSPPVKHLRNCGGKLVWASECP